MAEKNQPEQSPHEKLLELLGGRKSPTFDEFKQLVATLESHRILAKVFLLEGTPTVFEASPMKYVVFREQVADRFGVGSQDVCIVGSAKLGFSTSPHSFGEPFDKTSDVDVVIISDDYFYRGSSELFSALNHLDPSAATIRKYEQGKDGKAPPVVDLQDWRKVKDAIRNFVFENFNPGLLTQDHPLRKDIFDKMNSTAALFLALEPRVFVSKIRCRIFRTWKAAEDYYSNTLREASYAIKGDMKAVTDIDLDEDVAIVEQPKPSK